MKNLTVNLFKFLGAPVKLNLLFLILFGIMPISYAISIFISVLLHEMAHAFVANRKGYHVYGIEIGIFSGSASIDSNMHQSDSIPIVAAGPATNLILYLVALIAGIFIQNVYIDHFAYVNLFLFIFNILPIYPMDGGQLLRDILMTKGRKIGIDRRRGFDISAYTSLITSILLIVFSILFGQIFLAIFGGYFAYLSLKDLKYIK